ncbi:MAG: pilus assembly protein PilM [Sedimentisphaerales bacterium]|nr:pilus assembly protein PilM [Sedimentisphaerales bacterium]
MAKRFIGIDINSSHLCAVQMARNGNRFRMEKMVSSPLRRESDSLGETLNSLISSHNFDRRVPVAVLADHKNVFFHSVKADNLNGKQGNLSVRQDDQNIFPFGAADIVAVDCPRHYSRKDNISGLVTAIDRKSLHCRLDLLRQARMRCELVDAPVFALHAAVAVNHPEIADSRALLVYSDSGQTIVAVTDHSDIVAVRNLPDFTDTDNGTDSDNSIGSDSSDDSTVERTATFLLREMEMTWRSAFRKKIPQNAHLVLAGRIGHNSELVSIIQRSLPCRIISVDLTAKVTASALPDVPCELGLAQGIALRALSPNQIPGVNFLKADIAPTDETGVSGKHFVFTLILLAALASVFLMQLFVHRARLENKNNLIKAQITQLFRQTLPDEKNIVNATAQMGDHLNRLRKEYEFLGPIAGDSLDVLGVLDALSAHVPQRMNITLDSILIASSSVQISARCDSFETPYLWKKIMQAVPGFATVSVEVLDRNPETRLVKFTAHISLRLEP